MNFMDMQLGLLPPRPDARTLKLGRYSGELAPPPPSYSLLDKIIPPVGMMANDRMGNCTCAAAAHTVQAWTAANGRQVNVPDEKVISMYSAITGYDGSPESDRGAVELDVLKFWKKNPLAGHELTAYVQLDPKHTLETRQAVYYFGGAYIGLALPLTAQVQDVWVVASLHGDGEPWSWGGHAVNVVAYNKHWVWCITWGEVMRMSWNFFFAYCIEAWALLGKDWLKDDKSPTGFDFATLEADLSRIAS
jgi:hypothetical protein